MGRSNVAPRPRGSDGRGQMLEKQHPQPAPISSAASRKIFNCIVDDSALIAGVKHSTRDGIRKWVTQGAIRLFVPLQTIELLHRLARDGTERHHTEAKEAIQWLDKVTSDPTIDGRVVLEGMDEKYSFWSDVEKFVQPESLFSEQVSSEDDDDDDSNYGDDLDDSLANLALSDGSSVSSSHSHDGCPASTDSEPKALKALRRDTLVAKSQSQSHSPLHSARPSTDSLKRSAAKDKAPRNAVPSYLRPLFNHVVWRIHKETSPHHALDSFILLTNDIEKQAIARKFGIRAKPLEQLREAVAREDREFRNHQMFSKIEAGELKPAAANANGNGNANTNGNGTTNGIGNGESERPRSSREFDEPTDSDEDVVLFRPQPRVNGKPVFDPNDFGRGTPTPTCTTNANGCANSNAHAHTNSTPAARGTSAPRGARGAGRGTFTGPSPRGGRGSGAPAPRGGRGNAFVPRGTYTPPTQAFRGTAAGRGSVSPRLANRTLHAPPANAANGRGTPTRGTHNHAPGNRPTSANGLIRGAGGGRGAMSTGLVRDTAPPTDENGLLNPDSFARPAPLTNSLRGGRRKLWEPN